MCIKGICSSTRARHSSIQRRMMNPDDAAVLLLLLAAAAGGASGDCSTRDLDTLVDPNCATFYAEPGKKRKS